MTESNTNIPTPYEWGAVHVFEFDVATQSLRVVITAMPQWSGDWSHGWVMALARFNKVVVFDFEGEIPVVISSDCACDAFDELPSSALLDSVVRDGQWTKLQRAGRSRVISADVLPGDFRHFRLAAGFFWAEWLCTAVEFNLDEQPEPAEPPPEHRSGRPF